MDSFLNFCEIKVLVISKFTVEKLHQKICNFSHFVNSAPYFLVQIYNGFVIHISSWRLNIIVSRRHYSCNLITTSKIVLKLYKYTSYNLFYVPCFSKECNALHNFTYIREKKIQLYLLSSRFKFLYQSIALYISFPTNRASSTVLLFQFHYYNGILYHNPMW